MTVEFALAITIGYACIAFVFCVLALVEKLLPERWVYGEDDNGEA